MLWINNEQKVLTAEYSLRWVDRPGESPQPTLYYLGKRVTAAWRLEMNYECLEDTKGANANTA